MEQTSAALTFLSEHVELRTAVPCAGCTLCCHNDLIPVLPEHGDVPHEYEHDITEIPGVGPVATLKKNPVTKACVYLGDNGCTIHNRAPAVCKAFDCRLWFKSKTRAERRYLVKKGIAKQSVFDAGRERLHTLEDNG